MFEIEVLRQTAPLMLGKVYIRFYYYYDYMYIYICIVFLLFNYDYLYTAKLTYVMYIYIMLEYFLPQLFCYWKAERKKNMNIAFSSCPGLYFTNFLK